MGDSVHIQPGKENYKAGDVVSKPDAGKQNESMLAVENSPPLVHQVKRNDIDNKAWSNSFDVLRNKKVVEMEEGEIQSSRMENNAIQKIIEEALFEEHSRLKLKKSKGKEPVEEENGHQGRGFSPTT